MTFNTHDIRPGTAPEQAGTACLIDSGLTFLFLISRKHSYPHLVRKQQRDIKAYLWSIRKNTLMHVSYGHCPGLCIGVARDF